MTETQMRILSAMDAQLWYRPGDVGKLIEMPPGPVGVAIKAMQSVELIVQRWFKDEDRPKKMIRKYKLSVKGGVAKKVLVNARWNAERSERKLDPNRKRHL